MTELFTKHPAFQISLQEIVVFQVRKPFAFTQFVKILDEQMKFIVEMVVCLSA